MAEASGIASSGVRLGTRRGRIRSPRRKPAVAPGPITSPEWLAASLSVARRNANRERAGSLSELRCECGRLECKETWPAAAEAHRKNAGRFLVMPSHLDGGVVVRAADRFFVIERHGNLFPPSGGD
jgi:hypothetical protein